MLLLAEEGKLDLDDRVSDYLSASQLEDLEKADQATIRQLLQHSSGIYNYIVNLRFQTKSLNDLTRVRQPEKLLSYAGGKKADPNQIQTDSRQRLGWGSSESKRTTAQPT